MYVLYYSLYLYYDIIMIFFVWYFWKVERIDEFVWRIKRFVKVSRVLVNGFFFSDKKYKYRNCLWK